MSQESLAISPDDVMTGRALPWQMVSDLRRVAEFTNDQVRQIEEGIRLAEGVLTDDRVIEIVNVILSGNDAQAAARTIRNITPANKSTILRILDQWRRRDNELSDAFPEPVFESLKANLNELVQDVPSLKLMHKANRLLRDVGNELQSVLFVCDARPVYDDEHTQVEGFVSLVNLRLGVIKQNGDQDTFEVALTEDELDYLVKRGQDALNKFRVLQGSIGRRNMSGG